MLTVTLSFILHDSVRAMQNMVAAASNNPQRPSLGHFRKGQRQAATTKEQHSQFSASSDPNIPSIATCVIHLKLLAAFSQLKKTILSVDGLFGLQESGELDAADRRWTMFVANAVTRFEKWLQKLLATSSRPSLARSTATIPSEMDKLLEETEPLAWTRDKMPPLDVLMVLHSYMLNPHDFLHDCLRCGALSLWEAGFPWDLLAASIDEASLEYRPPESTVVAFEKHTGIGWSYMNPVNETTIQCPNCLKCVTVPWMELYSEGPSQMEKGNTLMPFNMTCPNCRSQISQHSICNARLKADLELLLKDDIVMPGTLLSKDGLISTASPDKPVDADAVLLNNILRDGMATDLLQEINQAQRNNSKLRLSSCVMNDTIISALTEGSIRDHAKGIDETEKTFSALMKSAQRMRVVYDKNISLFALDLVGAVIRQDVFIEKMQYFDWTRSAAVEHIVSRAVERYAGFCKVMAQNPGKTAVPTFDVDLVWHTHQLNPSKYYKYSLENCNNLFIDHDDKIVDDVLNNSFEWTCEQFANLTGKHYDKCLCWCCAILEQDSLSPKQRYNSNNKLSFPMKGLLKRLKRYEQPSPAESQVFSIQLNKFEKDYANTCNRLREADEKPISKKEFFEDYSWHYPAYSPHPEELGAT